MNKKGKSTIIFGLIVVLVLVTFAAVTVLAFHPGQNKNGEVPQGPHQTACDNQGRQGINIAIENGGMVHCGEVPQCVEVSPEEIHFGACTDISLIGELNILQCCTLEGPGGIDCGANQEWVVGVAAFPTCYISNS
ncbi:hypothetical protein J4407_03250 [Candidatus Pacearchaeota archaeon]|nr:hypothetical protein [Candidatus Pacearchaeota archaeon]